MSRVPASELVVHDYGNGMEGGEMTDWEEIVVWNTGPPVEADEGAYPGFEVPEDCVPCFAGGGDGGDGEVDGAFGGWDG